MLCFLIRVFWALILHTHFFDIEEIALRTAEVAQLPPQVLAEEVICLDSTSSGSEDDSKGRLHSIKDGKEVFSFVKQNQWRYLS